MRISTKYNDYNDVDIAVTWIGVHHTYTPIYTTTRVISFCYNHRRKGDVGLAEDWRPDRNSAGRSSPV